MEITREHIEKPRFIQVEKFVEARTNSIAQLLRAIDNDALVSGEVTKGPRTAAQRLPRHMRRRAMAYDIRRFPRTMREFAAAHLIAKHAKKCPSRFARRKQANSRDKFGRSNARNGKWLSTHVWHAKRFRMVQKWGFKLADRSFQRGFRAVLRDSNKQCVARDRSYYTCFRVESEDVATRILKTFSQKTCRAQTSRDEEEECHQFYVPGQYPHGYIGPARLQVVEGSSVVHIWMHPASKSQFLDAMRTHFHLKKIENSEGPEEYSDGKEMKICADGENLSRIHLSGPKSLQKLRDSIRLIDSDAFREEHNRFVRMAESKVMFEGTRDGETVYLLVEDPRTAWDRKTHLENKIRGETGESSSGPRQRPRSFWSREVRDQAVDNRMSDAEYQKRNSDLIGGVVATDARIPLLVVVRNAGLKALDGIDLLVPTPFAKDLWVALHRRAVRASGLRDELAAHLESRTLYFPIDDVESEAGRDSEEAMKQELQKTFLKKPHNRRCKFWSALSVMYPFEFRWDELIGRKAFVCRDNQKLREIQEGLKRGDLKTSEDSEEMLVPIRIEMVGRGRPKRFGIICWPSDEDLVVIRRNRNSEIIQKPRTSSEEAEDDVDEPMNSEFETKKPLEGFVSLDAASREKPISLKWLFEETTRLDDKSVKRKRANRKKREATKRRKLNFEARRAASEREETERNETPYRLSSDREIIGRLVAGEQSVLGGRGIGIGYVRAAALPRIASNYHSTKTVVLVRNSTSKYYHPAYLTVMTSAIQI